MESYQFLESELGYWIGSQHVVAVNSGTAALHAAIESFQFPLGSEVLVPEFTMVACARAVSLAGLRPVFVDCDDRLLINPEAIEEKITPKTKAIMAVHIYGRLCEMGRLASIAERHGLKVIEDRAEAHGATHTYTPDAACYSFYRNKIVAGEEGGAISFKNPEQAAFARRFRSLGFTDAHDFIHEPRGMNYRISNANAQQIRGSLRKLPINLATRRAIVEIYDKHVPVDWQMPEREAPWVYDVLLPRAGIQDVVVENLNREGIAARHGFKPMSEQPEYLGHYSSLNAYRLSQRVIYLPIQPLMPSDEPRRIVDRLRHYVAQR